MTYQLLPAEVGGWAVPEVWASLLRGECMKAAQATTSFFHQVPAVRMCMGLCLLAYKLTPQLRELNPNKECQPLLGIVHILALSDLW